DKLGVTPQAISEYIRYLSDNQYIKAEGRGRYYITPKGVEVILNYSEIFESYSRYIRKEVVHPIYISAAIADTDLTVNDKVGIYMKNGLLYAGKHSQSAMGYTINDAKKGMDVGISQVSGIIDHRIGTVYISKVPRIRDGGSKRISQTKLKDICKKVDFIGAVGLEAYLSLKNTNINPDVFFGAREGVIEAAFHGLNCLILIVDDEFVDFLKRLESLKISYNIHELV
ncbi:MAG TPA: Crp/Fnr family transcriptional regulator, partial [Methanocorpusculum sp.]|nr:Crp/Fnr family transcriptional regulator [Methanocorpusculum sp.]